MLRLVTVVTRRTVCTCSVITEGGFASAVTGVPSRSSVAIINVSGGPVRNVPTVTAVAVAGAVANASATITSPATVARDPGVKPVVDTAGCTGADVIGWPLIGTDGAAGTDPTAVRPPGTVPPGAFPFASTTAEPGVRPEGVGVLGGAGAGLAGCCSGGSADGTGT